MTTFRDRYINLLCKRVREELPENVDDIKWTANSDVLFLIALEDLKPVGINRHFIIAAIHNRLSKYFNRPISANFIWNRLEFFYNMSILHESDINSLPNDEVEFELPSEDFDEIVMKRLGVPLSHSSKAKPKQPVRMLTVKPAAPKEKDFEFVKPFPVTTMVSVKLNRHSVSHAKSTDKSHSSGRHASSDSQSKKSTRTDEESTKRTIKRERKEASNSPSSTRSSVKDTRQETSEPTKKKRSADASDSKKAEPPVKRMRV